ncbi:MAG: enoyl-CoA hydratase/isomerase family protein [bacterium]|nr:enoyl-CoA hydratase/isomerase family protein [bacterium]
MEYRNFDCEIADGRARLRLIGPGAPDLGELCDEFVDLMLRLQEDNAVRVVLLTDGDHSFELHHHLDGLADAQPQGGGFDTLAADDEISGRIITVIRECPKPVVAATRGDVRDSGLGFYLAADVHLAAKSASFTAASMQAGLIPGWGLLHTLPGLLGQGRALEFLWSGRTVGAAEAWQLGLVDRLLDEDMYEEELDTVVDRLRSLPQPAVRLTKLGVQQNQQFDMTNMLAYEWETQQQCWSSLETAEGLRAWREGREPVLEAPTQPEED